MPALKLTYGFLLFLADGVFYCDMTGSGSDDYIWIYMDGHAGASDLFLNIHDPPNWGHTVKVDLHVPGPRIGIHLADWTNSGKCDVFVQDRTTGKLTRYPNKVCNFFLLPSSKSPSVQYNTADH